MYKFKLHSPDIPSKIGNVITNCRIIWETDRETKYNERHRNKNKTVVETSIRIKLPLYFQ